MLMLPSDNFTAGENILLGTIGGTFLGWGTANIYQYSQHLIVKQAQTLTHIPHAVPDAQILYSASNLGLAFPAAFGKLAEFKKTQYKEEFGNEYYEEHKDHFEFKATQNTFPLSLLIYGTGMSLILNAEKNVFGFAKNIWNFAKPVINPTLKLGKYSL